MSEREEQSTPYGVTGEQRWTIETPEHVELVYTVAGPGSRCLALVIDSLIMFVADAVAFFLAMMVIVTYAKTSVDEMLRPGSEGETLVVWLMMAMLTMVHFAISMLYFVAFELAWNGQSPGKRIMGIRVMRDSGQPVGLFTSMIRNLIRIVDLLPLFYLAGFVSMMASRSWRRLGDLAAGTIVVRIERLGEGLGASDGTVRPPAAAPSPESMYIEQRLDQGGHARIDPEMLDLARRWLDRRRRFEPHVASHLAEKIASAAMERLGVTGVDPALFLVRVLAREESNKDS